MPIQFHCFISGEINLNGGQRVLSFASFPHPVDTQYHRDSRENSFSGGAIGDECLRESYRDVRCQSFNYVFIQEKCELSNRIKEAGPEDFVPNSERYYFRRDT
ncbi:hypothetical protein pdam_00025637 [Pocillopora damicornis]|uniref:Apple domain-containing protein n=1 Tax=Pocillopora damicornis TaxID=46731 RepID=A0A3M6V627_POCDA|nr:hypothetical protein pdam_00025637 [Pocillopora damicornis]